MALQYTRKTKESIQICRIRAEDLSLPTYEAYNAPLYHNMIYIHHVCISCMISHALLNIEEFDRPLFGCIVLNTPLLTHSEQSGCIYIGQFQAKNL
jgi:hypothetical protein